MYFFDKFEYAIDTQFLLKAIDLFISNADFVPEVPRVEKNQAQYSDYRFSEQEWVIIKKIHDILEVRFPTNLCTLTDVK